VVAGVRTLSVRTPIRPSIVGDRHFNLLESTYLMVFRQKSKNWHDRVLGSGAYDHHIQSSHTIIATRPTMVSFCSEKNIKNINLYLLLLIFTLAVLPVVA
jgi:hypothetical protein